MEKLEYVEANNNFRHFVSLEREYLQLFVNSTTILLAAYWLVGTIDALRYMVNFIAMFLSAGVLVTELRYSQYFKHFFNVAEEIEFENGGRQFLNISKYFSKPFLGIRSTNVIIAFYSSFLFCWCSILVLDIFNIAWFESVISQIPNIKMSNK
jgi:hypothetical protein